MKTFIKYVFYLVLILILYVVISAIYSGDLNKASTVEDVVTKVSDDTKTIVSDTVKDIEKSGK